MTDDSIPNVEGGKTTRLEFNSLPLNADVRGTIGGIRGHLERMGVEITDEQLENALKDAGLIREVEVTQLAANLEVFLDSIKNFPKETTFPELYKHARIFKLDPNYVKALGALARARPDDNPLTIADVLVMPVGELVKINQFGSKLLSALKDILEGMGHFDHNINVDEQ